MSYQPNVLLLDNAPGHQVSTPLDISVVYVPSHTTSLFQTEQSLKPLSSTKPTGNGERFGQFRKNCQGLLAHIQHFEGH
jgi:hypothetical protein